MVSRDYLFPYYDARHSDWECMDGHWCCIIATSQCFSIHPSNHSFHPSLCMNRPMFHLQSSFASVVHVVVVCFVISILSSEVYPIYMILHMFSTWSELKQHILCKKINVSTLIFMGVLHLGRSTKYRFELQLKRWHNYIIVRTTKFVIEEYTFPTFYHESQTSNTNVAKDIFSTFLALTACKVAPDRPWYQTYSPHNPN